MKHATSQFFPELSDMLQQRLVRVRPFWYLEAAVFLEAFGEHPSEEHVEAQQKNGELNFNYGHVITLQKPNGVIRYQSIGNIIPNMVNLW